MEYISSDTNVWIDFHSIEMLDLPFRLPCTFIMYEGTIRNELIKPEGLGEKLVSKGLVGVDITTEEFILAEELNSAYAKPSVHDCVALAIAKSRGLTLMTGDGALRKAAEKEGVTVIGTIGVLDRLREDGYLQKEEYVECFKRLDDLNGGVVRLPADAIKERMR